MFLYPLYSLFLGIKPCLLSAAILKLTCYSFQCLLTVLQFSYFQIHQTTHSFLLLSFDRDASNTHIFWLLWLLPISLYIGLCRDTLSLSFAVNMHGFYLWYLDYCLFNVVMKSKNYATMTFPQNPLIYIMLMQVFLFPFRRQLIMLGNPEERIRSHKSHCPLQ